MEYTLEIKNYSTHWSMRVLNSKGDCVRVHTGLLKHTGWHSKCFDRIMAIYENITVKRV